MQASRPRYVLIAETEPAGAGSQWRFALHAADASVSVAACDSEEGADEDRLVLLAVVRGLEALDHPADVTVVTRSSSVLKGLTRGLSEWRNNHWRWECFGRLTPVRDADLWRRVDQALQFHTVHCRSWRFDQPADLTSSPHRSGPPKPHFGRWRVTGAGERLPEAESWIDGRPDSPAMVIVQTPRSRRRVRFLEPVVVAG
jgi:ribonuclease HI